MFTENIKINKKKDAHPSPAPQRLEKDFAGRRTKKKGTCMTVEGQATLRLIPGHQGEHAEQAGRERSFCKTLQTPCKGKQDLQASEEMWHTC